MTLLSHQMTHPHRTLARKMNCLELYQFSQENKVPFYKFNKFILDQIDKCHLQKTKNADPCQFLDRKKALKYFTSAKIYA